MSAFLLAGLATCGACGAPLATVSTPTRRYVCAVGEQPACALVAYAADPIEELIGEAVQRALSQSGIDHAGLHWRAATIDRQRDVIALVAKSIVLRPSQAGYPGQLDPAAVEVAWST
jgi:hypothetical protein